MANRPSDLRARLVRALEADLIGPFDPESGEEVLRLPPSRWYLTGFLAPQGGREPEEQEDPLAEAPRCWPSRRAFFEPRLGL